MLLCQVIPHYRKQIKYSVENRTEQYSQVNSVQSVSQAYKRRTRIGGKGDIYLACKALIASRSCIYPLWEECFSLGTRQCSQNLQSQGPTAG